MVVAETSWTAINHEGEYSASVVDQGGRSVAPVARVEEAVAEEGDVEDREGEPEEEEKAEPKENEEEE